MNLQESWINIKKTPLLKQNKLLTNNIFFLYAFLGDGFHIKNPDTIKNIESWKKQNENWKIHILRKDYDNLVHFVELKFPWIINIYNNYTKNIQRCDTIRYMLMYEYGGIYTDIDVIAKLTLNNLFNMYPSANVIFGVGRIKTKEKCIQTTKIETIRGGELEISTR